MFITTRNILAGLSIALFSGYGQAGLEQVQQALQAGDYHIALDMLAAGNPEEQNSPQGRLLRGLAQAGLQNIDDAQTTLMALITELPDHPEPYNNLAALYASTGRMEEARELLNKAMHTHHAYATVYDNLTRITVEMSRSSYARALRLQSQEEGMQLAALHELSTHGPLLLAEATTTELATPGPVTEHTQLTEAEHITASAAPPIPEAVTPLKEAHSAATITEPTETALQPNSPDQEIQSVMLQWAKDWANQEIDGYLNTYSKDFVPSGNLNLAQWQQQRRQRLTRPDHIKIELSEIEVLALNAEHARVRLTQTYRSDRYSDQTRKEFQMINEGGRWRIRSERTLEVIAR